jgi:UDP-N-acetyl-D-mannosaminuronic acid dehydrogenase
VSNNRHHSKPIIQIFGLGYVGLPTAAVFADAGLRVIGVDVNPVAVETINSGRAHIQEPGLDEMLRRVVASGQLQATLKPQPADVFVIAVPTPFFADKRPDLSFVEAAAHMIAPLLKAGDLVILESTSPVGTTEQISRWLEAERSDLDFPHGDSSSCDVHVAHCPERILPGNVLHEVVHNDRIVGGITAACSEAAARFYRHAVAGDCHLTSARTAELCKLSENAYRDVNIAFANELSLICDKLEINVRELINLANLHPRVAILNPGAGVGGHCIAVDPWFIVDSATAESRLIRTARNVNDGMPAWVVDKVRQAIVTRLAALPSVAEADIVIACLGLSYKPDIDDLRESPAVEVVKRLVSTTTAKILVVEPHIEQLPMGFEARATLSLLGDSLGVADIVVVLVDHSEFHEIEWVTIDRCIIVDTTGRFLNY